MMMTMMMMILLSPRVLHPSSHNSSDHWSSSLVSPDSCTSPSPVRIAAIVRDLMCKFVVRFSLVCVCVLILTVQELTSIKVGDHVRVKPTVVTPKYKWGSVTHNSVGTVTG